MVLKECCSKCGLPLDIPREPVILTNDIFSLIHYETNTCEECGHQADGSTLPTVHKLISECCNKYIKEREDLIKFFKKFELLHDEARRKVCVEIPRFMKPDYKSSGDPAKDDLPEPYSWNIVFFEVVNRTPLSKVLVRDIDWERIEKEDEI